MRFAEVSLPAIRHNIAALRAHTGAGVIVVVKANAYGHGAAIVAPAVIAAGAEMVAVASIEEAAVLRESGFNAPILCWLHAEHLGYGAAVRLGVQLGVSSVAQLDRLAVAARSAGTVACAQLKLDTGLSRNGAAPDTWETLFAAAASAERAGLVRITGVFSHLANAGDAADRAQAARFDAGVRLLRAHGVAAPLRHLAASAAALSSPHLAYDAVRIGLAAFGLSPEQDGGAAVLGLRPVMTFATEIISLRWAAAGAGVSDGFTHTCRRESLLAQLPVGFGDGMPRALSDTGLAVSIGGERAPVVGQIAMDECVVDVTHLAGRALVGSRAVLFGDPAHGEPAVEEWAERLGTINYEIVAGIGPRVRRVSVDRGYPPREAPIHHSRPLREREV